MSSTKTLSLYRQLLRRSHVYAKVNSNYAWTNFIRNQFKSNVDEQNSARIKSLQFDAQEAITMLEASHEFEVCIYFKNIL